MSDIKTTVLKPDWKKKSTEKHKFIWYQNNVRYSLRYKRSFLK